MYVEKNVCEKVRFEMMVDRLKSYALEKNLKLEITTIGRIDKQ